MCENKQYFHILLICSSKKSIYYHNYSVTESYESLRDTSQFFDYQEICQSSKFIVKLTSYLVSFEPGTCWFGHQVVADNGGLHLTRSPITEANTQLQVNQILSLTTQVSDLVPEKTIRYCTLMASIFYH